MNIYGKTKGTELEKQIAQIAQGEAIGGAMYYALAYVAEKQFGLKEVAKQFIELGNQETNHGAFYSLLNGRYPYNEQSFWHMVRGLSKAEYRGECSVNQLADKLTKLGLSNEVIEQVKEFAKQEKHHGEVTNAIIEKYAPKEIVDNTNKPVYICSVCGFEYVGDINKEPDNYICPICGCAKGVFKKEI